MATIAKPEQWMNTSGETTPVWVHRMPFSKYPRFEPLKQDIKTDVCIVGSGIAGISVAYELVTRGKKVTMIEARNVLSGESGRTSGHLSNALDDGYANIAKKHGAHGAKIAADSHTWAIDRAAHIAKKLNIDCEFRYLPAIEISQYPRGDRRHDKEVSGLQEEVKAATQAGVHATYREGLAVQGWDAGPDQRDGALFSGQATFHPTKYLVGVLEWLRDHPNFQCFTHTRMMSVEEKDLVQVRTANGCTITASDVIEATCVPLQKLSVIAEMEYMRTYCIAIRVPKGSIEDCLLYDEAEEYKYVRFTHCDEKDDYLVIGGCDHKVGQDQVAGRFEELESWVRERFTRAGSVDYKWSGQIFEPVDYMAFIGKNQGMNHTYVVTGDSGNGLTHGILAGKLIADEIEGIENPWASLYNPNRLISIAKSLPSMLGHDMQINTQYKRYLQSDIKDIEDLGLGTGGVLHDSMATAPVAVYKDGEGQTHRFSAVCPHMKAVVSWNDAEKSWDCPVHGSRFSCDGVCVEGPAKSNLKPLDDFSKTRQQAQEAL
ncbi:hypothetical protein ETB97_009855 [Aspergillus alliaceus]|uniref:Rieske domain-containing protein n=1 Tax=Petromyces alliaceus TaxID=209559 RepID=A0A8H6E0H5_PETAA|nr:hypothetical protein ETB97_009855 [Aspergillus burnettii]